MMQSVLFARLFELAKSEILNFDGEIGNNSRLKS